MGEPLGDGGRLHGWLDPVAAEANTWQGSLALLPAGKQPWYGPSFGEPPEIVGSIKVRSLPDEEPAAIETQIRVKDEDEDWQKPVRFRRKDGEQQDSTVKSAPETRMKTGKNRSDSEEKMVSNRIRLSNPRPRSIGQTAKLSVRSSRPRMGGSMGTETTGEQATRNGPVQHDDFV